MGKRHIFEKPENRKVADVALTIMTEAEIRLKLLNEFLKMSELENKYEKNSIFFNTSAFFRGTAAKLSAEDIMKKVGHQPA